MAVVPLKFRCYQCNGLLGVSRSKVGTVVSCPKCRAELIVPEPAEGDLAPGEGPESSPASSAVGAAELGLSPDLIDIRPEDIRVEPGIDWVPRPAAETPSRADEFASPPPEPRPSPRPAEVEAPPTPRDPVPEAVVPPIRLDAPRIAEPRWTPPRSRDVVLPRSAVATWSLFVLLAQGMAFVAGLLAGHFLWRVH